jgi:putative ABC transport system ATP-binding protein
MNTLDPFLLLHKLSKVYASGKIHVAALSDVSLQLAPARFVAVTGASGSGKSTLLNLLGGLDTPTSGTIEVQGRRISDLDREELALYRRSSVGMIFQSFNLIPSRTALENVELPLIFAGVVKSERRERAAGWLAGVGLAGRLDHRPSELSGGEQQRVAIARALVNSPQMILADEPTGNLDSRTGREIVELLAQLNRERGLTVMIVSHEVPLMRDFSHELIQLQDGRIVSREGAE